MNYSKCITVVYKKNLKKVSLFCRVKQETGAPVLLTLPLHSHTPTHPMHRHSSLHSHSFAPSLFCIPFANTHPPLYSLYPSPPFHSSSSVLFLHTPFSSAQPLRSSNSFTTSLSEAKNTSWCCVSTASGNLEGQYLDHFQFVKTLKYCSFSFIFALILPRQLRFEKCACRKVAVAGINY